MDISSRFGLVIVSLLAGGLVGTAASASTTRGDAGHRILRATGITLEQVRSLGQSPLVVELDVSDSSRQAAFVGLVRIDGDGSELFSDDGDVWSAWLDSPRAVGRFDASAVDPNLAALRLPEDDFALLEDCQPLDCRFKLDAGGIERTRAIDWSSSDAREQFLAWFKQRLDAKVDSYQSDGLEGLITYADKEEPFPVAQGVTALERDAAGLLALYPSLDGYLDAYPAAPPTNVSDRFLWSIADLGFRPTLSIDHVVVSRDQARHGLPAAMALRTIYANHYLAGRLQLAAVIDGPTVFGVPGRFVLTLDRILFDEEIGRIKRSLLGRGLKSKVADRLAGIQVEAAKPG